MIGAYASLAVVVVASVVVGQALLSLCGRRELSWLAAPSGLAALLVIAGIAVRLPGHATAVAIALAAAVLLSALVLVARPPAGLLSAVSAGLPAALLAIAVASLPFIVAGRVGILGVGLVNDDMASHLLMASWLDERFVPEPVLVDQGYPLGPHALVAGLAKGLGVDLIEAFAGLTLAIPALTALLAFGALERLRPVARTLAAAATALPYLVAAYLAQEAFKEPIMALFLLAFALALPGVRGARDAVPLGLLAAGTLYVYSFPGLAWLVGAALVWGAFELVRQRRSGAELLRAAIVPTAVAAGVALLLVAPDLDRVREFADFRALDPDRANERGLGNLRGHLSPLEALGIWPTSEFRLSAGAGSLPAAVFYAGALLGAIALAFGLPRWIRNHGPTVPAALATALVVYAAARGYGTVYTSAKALAVAAPLITLIALGGLLGGAGRCADRGSLSEVGGACAAVGEDPSPERIPPRALAAALLLGMAVSSFLVLRQAPVGPTDHMDELAQIRPLVEGEKVLFLGRDNFVLYSLRGSRPFTHVRNFYDPYFVKPNFELKHVASKFDFDSVTAKKLAKFPYVITTRAAYGSGPPRTYEPVLLTDSYALWRAGGGSASRRPAETGPEPTGPLRCEGAARFAGGVAPATPAVRQDAAAWSPSATIENGSPATVELELPQGSWHLSLQYDATRAIALTAPGFEAELPGNLDYRGVAPYWPAGALELPEVGTVTIEASVEAPSAIGRRLGAQSVAHLGAIAATRASDGYVVGAEPPYPGAGERPGLVRCGDEADWVHAG